MRTLSAGLLSAQRAASGTPLIVLTINTVNLASRILYIDHKEKPFGGTATVILRNDDKGLTTDYRGDKVVIGYGFSGQGTSACAPLWVLHQHKESMEGHLVVVYECIDIWLKLALIKFGSGGTDLTGTIYGIFERGYKVTGSSSGATGTVIYAGVGYIAVGQTSGTFTTSDNVQWDEDNSVYIDVSAVADFGGGSVGWDGDTNILGILNEIVGGLTDFVLDSSDGIVDSTQPRYTNIPLGARGIDVIKDLINRTTCAFRAEADEDIHVFAMSATPGTDYTYNGVHRFLTNVRTSSSILPNRIIVYSTDFAPDGLTLFSGTAIDTVAYGRFEMYVDEIIQVVTASDVECQQIADSKLSRVQKESTRGLIEVPMNCGQELFDYVKIEDARLAEDYYGWVGSIQRITEPGKYTMYLGLGGLAGGEDMPDEGEYPLPNIWTIPATPSHRVDIDWAAILPKAIQGYHHDITFSATDQDTVAWAAGTIKFYDGTTQAILAGNTGNLADTAIRYIYFDLDDASPNVLKVATSYLTNMDLETGLVCIVQKGSEAGILATFIPSYGKEPLMTPDFIDMTGLKAFTFGDGTHIQGIFSTQIQAGHILVSSDTTFAAGYNPNTALLAAQDAQATADGKVTTFYTSAAPTAEGVGDLWLDTDDDRLYRWNGTTWVEIQDADIAQAIAAAGTAQSTADGKIVTFYVDTAPTAEGVGDLWIDTNDKNKLYRWSGSAWILVRDTGIAQALADAASALAAADGEIIGYYQDAEPGSGMSFGDIWIDTDGHTPPTTADIYRYEDIDGGSTGALAWRAAATNAIGIVYLNAYGAQSTADGKITTFYDTTAPSADGVGDLWIDTSDGNKLYRASAAGSASWVEVPPELANANSTGKWYGKAGVVIDADNGISIYGGQTGLRTFATQAHYNAGTPVQCSVDTDGKISAGAGTVLLDSFGLTIKGQKLLIKDAAGTARGNLWGATNLMYLSDGYSDLKFDSTSVVLQSDGNVELDAVDRAQVHGDRVEIEGGTTCVAYPDDIEMEAQSEVRIYAPNTDIALLADVFAEGIDPVAYNDKLGYLEDWYHIYCHDLTTDTGSYDEYDDLALIKGMVADKNNPKKLDADGIAFLKSTLEEELADCIDRLDRRDERIANRNILVQDKIEKRIEKLASREQTPKVKAELDKWKDRKSKNEASLSKLGHDRADKIKFCKKQFKERKQMLPVGNALGLAIGALRQAAYKIDDLEDRIKALEAK